jgi:hypothetical protein
LTFRKGERVRVVATGQLDEVMYVWPSMYPPIITAGGLYTTEELEGAGTATPQEEEDLCELIRAFRQEERVREEY